MRLLVLLITVLSSTVYASEQDVYFHLHQAYELLEMHSKGNCPSATRQVKEHLIAADIENGKSKTAFKDKLDRLWTLFNSLPTTRTVDVERVRSEIQLLADVRLLKHQQSWHAELRTSCY